jgi:hypothetical protein
MEWEAYHILSALCHVTCNIQHLNICNISYRSPFADQTKSFPTRDISKFVTSLREHFKMGLQSSIAQSWKVESRFSLYIWLPHAGHKKARDMSFLWSGSTWLWAWRRTSAMTPGWLDRWCSKRVHNKFVHSHLAYCCNLGNSLARTYMWNIKKTRRRLK